MARDNKHTKALIQHARAMNALMPQTGAVTKATMSKYGYPLSGGAHSEPVAALRSAIGTSQRQRKGRVPITLAPTPWDKERDDGHQE